MPWFRVDDDFALHPKAIAAGNQALGLWVRAGAYASQYLTEGFVPAGMVGTLGGRPRDAQALVDARLWIRVEGGYLFHEWEQRQPTKAQVEADRAVAAERQRRARERAKKAREDAQRDPQPPADTGDVTGDVTRDVTRDSRSPRPGPARPTNPLLTLAGRLGLVDARELTAGLPDEVRDEWQTIVGEGVDLDDEARAYLAHFGDQIPRHPRRAWLGWLAKAREHAERARPAAPPVPAPRCQVPGCTGGWLPEQDDRPVPCPTCRPHLQPVPKPEAS